MKHLLKMLDLSKEEILDILNLADQLLSLIHISEPTRPY